MRRLKELISISVICLMIIPVLTNSCKEDEIIELKTSTLTTLISQAEYQIENANPAEYPEGAINTLQTAIDLASTTLTDATLQDEIDTAVTVLQAAISVFENSRTVLEYSDLDVAITAAENILSNAEEGESVGMYFVGSIATLQAAVDAAKTVKENASGQSEIDAAVTVLNEAFNVFKVSVVAPNDCLLFEGNGIVNCGESDPFNTTNLTIEAWINPTNFEGGYIASTEGDSDGTAFGYAFRMSGSQQLDMTIGLNGNWESCKSPENALEAGTWYHVAATYDGNQIKIYINGVLSGTSDVQGTIANVAATYMVLGDSPTWTGRTFRGKMYDVRAWNVTRTDAEIMENKDIFLTGDEQGLVANWPFWIRTDDVEILDLTGNYTAALQGVSWTTID